MIELRKERTPGRRSVTRLYVAGEHWPRDKTFALTAFATLIAVIAIASVTGRL